MLLHKSRPGDLKMRRLNLNVTQLITRLERLSRRANKGAVSKSREHLGAF